MKNSWIWGTVNSHSGKFLEFMVRMCYHFLFSTSKNSSNSNFLLNFLVFNNVRDDIKSSGKFAFFTRLMKTPERWLALPRRALLVSVIRKSSEDKLPGFRIIPQLHVHGKIATKNWGGEGVWDPIFSLVKIANLPKLLMWSLRDT